MIKKMVGFEAEFLLRKKKNGELVFPGEYGFSTDAYPLLGEVRAEPADTPLEAAVNLATVWQREMMRAANMELYLETAGFVKISPDLATKAKRRMGTKEVSEAQNIHGTDILNYSDEVYKNGRLSHRMVSAGLHVHFSAERVKTMTVLRHDIYEYEPIHLPLGIGTDGVTAHLHLFNRKHVRQEPVFDEETVRASVITVPVIRYLVEQMDTLLPDYLAGGIKELKFRQPGYYEVKEHGVEYRSLPMTPKVLDNIHNISQFAFQLLRSL